MITIILTVILITGPGQKDVSQSHEMDSLAACFDAAKAWDEQIPGAAGGIGFGSGCSITEDNSGIQVEE